MARKRFIKKNAIPLSDREKSDMQREFSLLFLIVSIIIYIVGTLFLSSCGSTLRFYNIETNVIHTNRYTLDTTTFYFNCDTIAINGNGYFITKTKQNEK